MQVHTRLKSPDREWMILKCMCLAMMGARFGTGYSESTNLKVHGSEKCGTYKFDGGVITITIQGNAGVIVEEYKYFGTETGI